ncbi:hypothetical protein Tco_0337215 [Tanacetum coccineum]
MNHQTSSVPQIAYQSPQVSTQPMTESPLVDSGFVVPIFSPGDDPIRFPSTNNQLRTSSNPRNQATIQDGRSHSWQQFSGRTMQKYRVLIIRVMLLVLGETMQLDRQGLLNATIVKVKNIWLGNALSLSDQGMQHGIRKKAMLAEAQEAGQILDEEQLAFLADPGVLDGQAVQTIIPNNAAFQTKDLDTYDSDCDDILNAKAVLMANISNYGSPLHLNVTFVSETYLNGMGKSNKVCNAIQDFKQTSVTNFIDNEIHSYSNIILYS